MGVTDWFRPETPYIPCNGCPYYFSRLDPPDYNGYTFEIDGTYYIRANKYDTVIFVSKEICKLGSFISLDYFENSTISEIVDKMKTLAAFG